MVRLGFVSSAKIQSPLSKSSFGGKQNGDTQHLPVVVRLWRTLQKFGVTLSEHQKHLERGNCLWLCQWLRRRDGSQSFCWRGYAMRNRSHSRQLPLVGPYFDQESTLMCYPTQFVGSSRHTWDPSWAADIALPWARITDHVTCSKRSSAPSSNDHVTLDLCSKTTGYPNNDDAKTKCLTKGRGKVPREVSSCQPVICLKLRFKLRKLGEDDPNSRKGKIRYWRDENRYFRYLTKGSSSFCIWVHITPLEF